MKSIEKASDARRANVFFGGLQSFFLSANCSFFSFLVLYLDKQGYRESQIGTAMALISIVGIFTPSIMGYIADYVVPIKSVIALMLILSIPVAFSLHFTVHWVPLAMLSISVLGITERSLISVVDSWGMKLRSRRIDLNYGLTRGIASLAFAMTALTLGRFYDRFGIERLFWAHALLALMAFVFALFLQGVPTAAKKTREKNYFHALQGLIANRTYMVFLICLILQSLSRVSLHTFQPLLLTSLGGTSTHLGAAMFVQAASEAPIMFASSRILRRYHVESMLMLGFAFTVLRLLTVLWAPTVGWFIAVQAIQSISHGLFLPCALYYISKIAPDEMRATAITLAMSLGIGLSGIFGNSIGGRIAQAYQVETVYWVFIVLTSIAFVLFSGHCIWQRTRSKH